MSMKKARKRVARGAALLDAKRPGWRDQINLKDLSLSSCTNCIIGQTFGPEYEADEANFGLGDPFGHGVQVLDLEDGEAYRLVPRHGFDTDDHGTVTYAELNRAWRELLAPVEGVA